MTSITTALQHHIKPLRQFYAEASVNDSPPYREIGVIIMEHGNPVPVADLLIGLNDEGKLRVLISGGGNAESHVLAVYPELSGPAMVERHY
jgi:hypothetical protein